MTIVRLQACRRILLTMRGMVNSLLDMVEEELYTRGALREKANPRPLAISGTLHVDE